MHRSIKVQSQGLEAPALNNPQLIQAGFDHYREDCTGCHTAPGASISEFAQGFYPKAPDLAEEALEMSSEQLFWVIKHGIKMTAMPAWGPTHTNEEIWSIVAFVKQLPNISAADYQRLENAAHPDEALESPPANQQIPEQPSINTPEANLAPSP